MATQLTHDDYAVGWISALPIELAAAQKSLDERHKPLPSREGDDNVYILGRIAAHNVVLACLPAGQTRTNSAASVVEQMRATFREMLLGLMVGIGGGVPSLENDIRLGDVMVGQPGIRHGGVVQYDFGKATPDGFMPTSFLNAAPRPLPNAVSALRASHDVGEGSLMAHISEIEKTPRFARESAGEDVLFEAAYRHVGSGECDLCDLSHKVSRPIRAASNVRVHYGIIASGNKVVRDAMEKDRISSQLDGVLCFEMEAAGLSNSFP